MTHSYVDTIRDDPAAKPPPDIIPNYDNPPNDNGLAVAVIIASMSITTIAILMRIYAKLFCTRQVKFEDYLGLLSFPFFIAGTSMLIAIPRDTGFFVHQWNLRVRDLEKFIYAYFLSTILYCFTLLLAKAAILLEWTHVFVVRSHRSRFYWTCYAMITANTALYLATIITTNLVCTPRERIWRRYLPGTCVNINAFNIFIAVFHLIFDILMLVLPQTIIWKLKLATKHKVGVSVAFSGNAIACIWAAGRVASAIHLGSSEDSSYAYSQYIMWGLAEVATAQLVFCVPTIPIVFQKMKFLHKFYSFLLSKLTITPSPERLASKHTASQSTPVTDLQTASNAACTTLESGSSRHIEELEPSRPQVTQALDQQRTGSGFYSQGITVTTEIDITLKDKPGSPSSVKATWITPWRG
ncbi:hypothetical protein F5Y01DRAFT_311241 [Xylaria sp. FL0043]|nr:hypothetical protein F5Y01DRAFT_311241 [Xylaria sp. FL0043]